jgi:hypothetical protein
VQVLEDLPLDHPLVLTLCEVSQQLTLFLCCLLQNQPHQLTGRRQRQAAAAAAAAQAAAAAPGPSTSSRIALSEFPTLDQAAAAEKREDDGQVFKDPLLDTLGALKMSKCDEREFVNCWMHCFIPC